MANFFSNNAMLLIELIVALIVGALLVLIAKLAQGYWQKYAERISSDKQFEDALTSEFDDGRKNKNSLWRKWNRYWEKRLVDSGANILAANRDNAGKIIIYIDLGLLAVLTLVLGGSFLGALMITVVLTILASFILGMMANKKIEKLTNQVPAFLSSLRAANDTNSSTRAALLQAIGTTSDELHEELAPVEEQLAAGGSIKTVLMDFYDKTSLDILQFLMACIVLVNESGKDMREQLKVIQEIVDAQMEVDRHLKKAIASVMPTIYVSSGLIPGLFLYTYIVQPISRQFWFRSFFAWIMFLLVLGLFGLGLFMTKHMVDNIKKL